MSRNRFHEELDQLGQQVEDMAHLASRMLSLGVRSLEELDHGLADEVIAERDELAEFDEAIETRALALLTLQSPVARDLRRIGAILKLITYLNRIGRYGYDIARVAKAWPEGEGHIARMVSIRSMGDDVGEMVRLVIEAFKQGAPPETDRLMSLEDDVDAQRYSVWRECLTFMAQDSHTIERCAHYMMVARYLERCGDNAVKIAEKLHYAATGERLLLK